MADNPEPFTETTTDVARAVPCDAGTVREYEALGLIEAKRLVNGMRLFRASAAQQVRKIRTERLAHRGGRRIRAAATV